VQEETRISRDNHVLARLYHDRKIQRKWPPIPGRCQKTTGKIGKGGAGRSWWFRNVRNCCNIPGAATLYSERVHERCKKVQLMRSIRGIECPGSDDARLRSTRDTCVAPDRADFARHAGKLDLIEAFPIDGPSPGRVGRCS